MTSERDSRSLFSLNAAKMANYSLMMTPTPCWVAGCIISIKPTYSCNGALAYLFTYLHSWLGEYKTGNISETVEDRAKVTINGLYKVVHGLSIASKVYDLEWPLRKVQSHWFLKCGKNGEIQISIVTLTSLEYVTFGKPQNNKRTVWIVLYSGFARLALRLNASCYTLQCCNFLLCTPIGPMHLYSP